MFELAQTGVPETAHNKSFTTTLKLLAIVCVRHYKSHAGHPQLTDGGRHRYSGTQFWTGLRLLMIVVKNAETRSPQTTLDSNPATESYPQLLQKFSLDKELRDNV